MIQTYDRILLLDVYYYVANSTVFCHPTSYVKISLKVQRYKLGTKNRGRIKLM